MPLPDNTTPAPTPTPTPTPPEGAPAAPPADDLPLTITKAFEDYEQRQQQETPPSPVAPRQPRDGQGRFAPKDVPAQVAQPAQGVPTPDRGASVTTAPNGQPSVAQPGVQPPAPEEAPKTWKAELKDKWAKLDPDVRAEITRRETDIERGMQSASDRVRVANAVMAEFEPYGEILSAEGATPVAAIRTLLQTAYALRTGGPEYRKAILLDLARQYQIDLTQGINGELAQAQAQLAMGDISGREAAAAQQAMEMERASSVLAMFAAQPGHEHFETVKQVMGNLLATGVCPDLETAYQQAVVLHPATSKYAVEARAKAILAQQQQEEQARRNAASSVGTGLGGFGGGPAPVPAAKSDDLRSSISAAFDAIAGGS